MARADLHLHSRYSVSSSEFLIRAIGLDESYTELHDLYAQAKARGMDLVTVTDHDTIEGALRLNEMHPDDTFVSVEVTLRFPEDNNKGHLLVYGVNEQQFAHIQTIRKDVYELRDYVLDQRLAHSLAHATYDMDGLLTLEHLEKYILLFDVFEARNGSRSTQHNGIWTSILKQLTPERIEDLYRRHRIEPASDTPWIKGFTAGSDCHAGLFIGDTFTEVAGASNADAFLHGLRERESDFHGADGSFRKMAFSMYKILYDHTQAENKGSTRKRPSNAVEAFNAILFSDRKLSFRDRIRLRKARKHADLRTRMRGALLADLAERFAGPRPLFSNADVDWIYDRVSEFLDGYFHQTLEALASPDKTSRSFSSLGQLMSFLPVPLTAAPFLATLKILFSNNNVVNSARTQLQGNFKPEEKPVLWFTDTISDLNGVSQTLRLFAGNAKERDLPLQLVCCDPGDDADRANLPDNTLMLPLVHSFVPEVYASYTLRFPSLLESLRGIVDASPQEIIISTPGPVGLLGLMAAQILSVPARGIYHTDFRVQLELITGTGMLPGMADEFNRWFFNGMDEIIVPSAVYKGMLSERGYRADKMSVMRRGLETEAFGMDETAAAADRPFTLLWAGRVSLDKNLEYLLERYKELRERDANVELHIAGDGPARAHYEAMSNDLNLQGVVWLGELNRAELRDVYRSTDVLVFPSTMDTFGMVVFEALATGLPCLVTDIGGPQELIINADAGKVLPLEDTHTWVAEIERLATLRRNDIPAWLARRQRLVEAMQINASMDTALNAMLGIEIEDESELPGPSTPDMGHDQRAA